MTRFFATLAALPVQLNLWLCRARCAAEALPRRAWPHTAWWAATSDACSESDALSVHTIDLCLAHSVQPCSPAAPEHQAPDIEHQAHLHRACTGRMACRTPWPATSRRISCSSAASARACAPPPPTPPPRPMPPIQPPPSPTRRWCARRSRLTTSSKSSRRSSQMVCLTPAGASAPGCALPCAHCCWATAAGLTTAASPPDHPPLAVASHVP